MSGKGDKGAIRNDEFFKIILVRNIQNKDKIAIGVKDEIKWETEKRHSIIASILTAVKELSS